jgi:hypothetical protein
VKAVTEVTVWGVKCGKSFQLVFMGHLPQKGVELSLWHCEGKTDNLKTT